MKPVILRLERHWTFGGQVYTIEDVVSNVRMIRVIEGAM